MKRKSKSAERVPTSLRICGTDGQVRLQAVEAEGDGQPALRRFTMTAYTGGAMVLEGWMHPVVVDLAGLKVAKKSRPILKDHDRGQIVGHTDAITVGEQTLEVAGVVSGAGSVAQEIIASSQNGFPWQASLGARANKVVFILKGRTAQANGREFAGPVYIARKSTLGEVSFVALGADDDTSARVAASAGSTTEVTSMEFEAWAEQQGFAVDELDETNLASLKAVFADVQPTATVTSEDEPEGEDRPPNLAAQMRTEVAAEARRIEAIRRVCAGEHADIEAKAIEEGWDETRTELELLRAKRPKGPAIHSEDGSGRHAPSLEAALCLSAGLPEKQVGEWFDDRVMNEATGRDLRGAGLHTLLYEVIRAAGGYVRPGRVDDDMIRSAFEANNRLIQASSGFSTISLSGILSNVANKAMLAAYNAVNAVGTRICGSTDVNDFKEVSRYRMTAAGTFLKVGPDGELKHTTLDEEEYKNRVETYGRMIALTRQMMINDELGAFLQIPRAIGRMSALALEEAVFTLLLSNPNTFFDASKNNYFDGATSALDIDSLTTAEQMFLDRTDKNGKPILVQPTIILVPTSLKVTAEQLFTEVWLNQVPASNKAKPATNPHAGKFRPICSPYLSLSSLPGNSTTAWYLLADPNDVAAMEIAHLRGRRTPTIESGQTDFNTLGMQWRGFFDFGVAMQDHRAAVKSKGAA